MPLGAQNSVYSTLKAHEEFTEFFDLLSGSLGTDANLLASTQSLGEYKYTVGMERQGNRNITLMDNYNYTVYVPTNESIRDLINRDLLPTWDDYNAIRLETWGTKELRDSAQKIVKDIITGFLRYHIQDHAIAINMAPETYETDDQGNKKLLYDNSYESMRRNPETGRFYPITVDFSNSQMTMVDVQKQQRHVVTANGLYNLLCREYWFYMPSDSRTKATVYSASDAVVHQIDGPLMFREMKSWKEQLKALGRE